MACFRTGGLRNDRNEEVVSYRNSLPDNLPIYYVHGLFGGIGPTGELMAYLYEDGPRMPRAFHAEVSSDGGTITSIEPLEPTTAERRVLAKLVVPVAVAEGMVEWLKLMSTTAEAAIVKAHGDRSSDHL